MASVDARNLQNSSMAGFVALLAGMCCSAAADEPAPLRYTTSWLGNSFGGGPDWVQNFAESLCVLPDGTCVVGSFWDEAGREVGLYKDGRPVGKLEHTHMRGGKAIAASETYHLLCTHVRARGSARSRRGRGAARRADLFVRRLPLHARRQGRAVPGRQDSRSRTWSSSAKAPTTMT